jgi:CelD/BcsL family acetyltransferase involved in cellulose biosynthesis
VNRAVVASTPFLEALPAAEIARFESSWRELARRTADPNPFAHPAFLAPALRHVAKGRLAALAVWEGPERARLDGLAILSRPRRPFALAEVWRSDQAALPALLVGRERATATLLAVMDWLAAHHPAPPALSIPWLAADGAVARAFREAAAMRGARIVLANPRQRAALVCGASADVEAVLDRKRRKEWARLRRRLEERGALAFGWASGGGAVEDFLALEASGWKGGRGTALLADPGLAAFAREVLAGFAAEGQLRVARLALDGRPIAAGAALVSGDRAFFWKTGFDESLAAFSPGVQLTLAMAADLAADPRLTLADSCADPDHPMIDRIWTDRIALGDFVVALRPGDGLALDVALAARRVRARLRERIKRLLGSARGAR